MSDSHDADLKDDVETRPVDSLVPYGENPKEHPTGQVDKIASSIRRFGFDQPIVVDGKGTIIKGHGRYQAAQKLNLSSVPVIEQTTLSSAEARAARIADNRVADSGFNDDLLATELDLLKESDVPTEATEMDETEIADLLDPPDLDVPEEFEQIDGDELEFEHECPECGYQW